MNSWRAASRRQSAARGNWRGENHKYGDGSLPNGIRNATMENPMTPPRLLLLLGVAFVLLLLGLSAGAWWYLFGPNEIDSAELVPANTVAFASIPDAAKVLEGYETSQLKTLIESPNAKPVHDAIVNLVGQ